MANPHKGRRILALACSGLAIAALQAAPAWAGIGSISGVVSAPGGAPQPGVAVTAIGTGSLGSEVYWRRTVTNATGSYTFTGLEFATYRLFFDPEPPATQLAFQWSGGVNDPAAALALVVSSATPTFTSVNAALQADADEDGLADAFEPTWCDSALGTCANPTSTDSDSDGLADGDEVHLSRTSPLRQDSSTLLGAWWPNGITDANEDPDADLLNNAEELNTALWSQRTRPLDTDTDDDTLSDYEESRNLGNDTNTSNPDTDGDGTSDANEDHDGDSLTNRRELDLRLNPRSQNSDGTGPIDGSENTDADPLLVSQESAAAACGFVGWGTYVCASPYDSDSDNDGLADNVDSLPVNPSALAEPTTGPFGLQPLATYPSASLVIGAQQTLMVNPATSFAIDEAGTDSLVLQVSLPYPFAAGYLQLLPAGATPPTTITSVWFHLGERQTKLAVVKLGSNGDFTVRNQSTQPQVVTLQLVGRFGRDAGGGHERYRSALATSFLDTGTGAWMGTPARFDLHPEVAIPADPTGRGVGDDLTDVERAVLLVTHVPPVGATANTFIVDVAPGSTAVAETLDRISGREDTPQQRIVSVKLHHNGGPLAQLVHVQGKTRLRVALLGYYVAGEYFEAKPHSAGDRTLQLTHAATVTEDLRGIDGIFGASYALLSLTARNATNSGTVSVGGVPQLAVRTGATTSNTVLAPVDANGAIALRYDAAAGNTAEVSYDILGWFEHSYYPPGTGFTAPPIGARFTSLPAPSQLFAFYIANSEVKLSVVNTAGVPARGASQVLLSIQSWWGFGVPTAPTELYAWASGRKRPTNPVLRVGPGRADSAVLAVDVGADGKVSLQTATNIALYAQITVLGWLTPYTGAGSTLVAMIGDSITAGAGVTHHQLGNDAMQINTLGLGSHTSHDLRPWADQIGYTNPSHAIVYLGTNDAFHGLLGPIGHVPKDELRRYSTDHFPATTCVTYVANFLGPEIQALVDENPPRRNLIRFHDFLAQNDRTRVTPRFPAAPAQPYLGLVQRQYALLGSDGIHFGGTGNEAQALLYQYAVLGSTPALARTMFSPSVRYPNATPPNFASYVTRNCN